MGFIPFTIIDFIDIFLVAGLLFCLYRATRGTNAPYILAGIIMIYVVWVIVRALNMELLSTILGQVISVGVIALIIVFQPEIRRFLQMIGMRQKELDFISRIFSVGRKGDDVNTSPIVSACLDMSESKTGALIVIMQKDDLQFIIEGGIAIDANVSVSTAHDEVHIPYSLLLTRLNSVITLEFANRHVDFHLWIEPSSPDTFR